MMGLETAKIIGTPLRRRKREKEREREREREGERGREI